MNNQEIYEICRRNVLERGEAIILESPMNYIDGYFMINFAHGNSYIERSFLNGILVYEFNRIGAGDNIYSIEEAFINKFQ